MAAREVSFKENIWSVSCYKYFECFPHFLSAFVCWMTSYVPRSVPVDSQDNEGMGAVCQKTAHLCWMRQRFLMRCPPQKNKIKIKIQFTLEQWSIEVNGLSYMWIFISQPRAVETHTVQKSAGSWESANAEGGFKLDLQWLVFCGDSGVSDHSPSLVHRSTVSTRRIHRPWEDLRVG